MDRKKELKFEYRQLKPQMGILSVSSKKGRKCYIEATQDLKSTKNRLEFQLKAGLCNNCALQKDWTDSGAENFMFEILEYLEYDKDDSKTDYSEDLALLKMIWEEKLAKENYEFYKK